MLMILLKFPCVFPLLLMNSIKYILKEEIGLKFVNYTNLINLPFLECFTKAP